MRIFLPVKKIVSTITHIAPEKFDYNAFRYRDQFVDCYQAMCIKSAEDLKALTNKPIIPLQFWVNENLWKVLPFKRSVLREKNGLPLEIKLIGSFQRDTEGHDLKSPKLVKGPDIFCDYIERLDEPVEVVLAGWRRQYVMRRLDELGIKYHYFEMCEFEQINELYNCIDLYVVSSRREGGPQAVPECAITQTPIISTDVGLACEILSPESVNDDLFKAVPNVKYALQEVEQYKMEYQFEKFIELFKTLL